MQVAVLACLASASAAVVPAAYAGYGYAGYPAGYAAAPYAYGKAWTVKILNLLTVYILSSKQNKSTNLKQLWLDLSPESQ